MNANQYPSIESIRERDERAMQESSIPRFFDPTTGYIEYGAVRPNSLPASGPAR